MTLLGEEIHLFAKNKLLSLLLWPNVIPNSSILTTGKKKTSGTYKAAQKGTLAWAHGPTKGHNSKQISRLQLFKMKGEIISSVPGVRRVAQQEANQVQFTDRYQILNRIILFQSWKQHWAIKQSIYLSRKQPLRLIVPEREREIKKWHCWRLHTADSKGYYQRKPALLLPASPKATELTKGKKQSSSRGKGMWTAPLAHCTTLDNRGRKISPDFL